MALGIGLVLLVAVGGIVWGRSGNRDEPAAAGTVLVSMGEYETYMKVIGTADARFLSYVPEYIVHTATHERIPLRQAAQDFLAGTAGVAENMGGFYLVEPRKGQSLTNPIRVKLWHRTNHYGGGVLRVTDANYKLLAELRLPEISHWNIIYHYYEAEMAFDQPDTAGGFIIGYSWDAGDEPEEARKYYVIPISFE
jgi:hypothetical protein